MKTNFKSYISPLLILGLGVLFTHNANALNLSDAVIKDLIAEQRPMAELEPNPAYQPQLKPNEKRLKVSAWVDRKNATYRLGDTVIFYIKANKDAYITLFDIGTTGKAHVIFPNKFQRTNFVQAGEVVSIPQAAAKFQFKVGGIAGTELVKVIATSTRETLIEDKYLADAGPFKAIKKDIGVFPADIDGRLNRPENKTEWSVYEKILRIHR